MNSHQTVEEYYQELAPAYDQDRFANTYGQFIHQQEYAILYKLLPYPAQVPTLDLACGTGRLTPWATHGLDVSSAMIEEARKKLPNKSFTVGNALATPYSDQAFESVYSFHLLMHLQPNEIPKILEEVARVLKPGGRFIFDIPSRRRRALTNYKAQGWHGAQSLSISEIKNMVGDSWILHSYIGVLFTPIHRLPTALRSPLRWVDNLLCHSPWREYASYLVVELVKR